MQVPKHAISPINVQILFRNSPLFRESLSQASKYGIIIALAIIRAGRAVSEANKPQRRRVQPRGAMYTGGLHATWHIHTRTEEELIWR